MLNSNEKKAKLIDVRFGGGSDYDRMEEVKDVGLPQGMNYLDFSGPGDWLTHEPDFLYKEFASD